MVILQHGLLDSFLAWLLNGSESLAFKLVEAGYDVWLNNSRGNRHSKDHQFLQFKLENPDMANEHINPSILKNREVYFDYSFHELGVYDQPALWKYVIKETGQEKIAYIGHS